MNFELILAHLDDETELFFERDEDLLLVEELLDQPRCEGVYVAVPQC